MREDKKGPFGAGARRVLCKPSCSSSLVAMAPLFLDAVPPAVHLLGLALIFVIVVSVHANKNRQLPLPPGPRAWPVVGNLLDVPRKRAFFGYSKWASDYGEWLTRFLAVTILKYNAGSDILFMQLPSQPVIIVNTVEAANDLMYKRSSIYSDKPQTIMDELCVVFLRPCRSKLTLGFPSQCRLGLGNPYYAVWSPMATSKAILSSALPCGCRAQIP